MGNLSELGVIAIVVALAGFYAGVTNCTGKRKLQIAGVSLGILVVSIIFLGWGDVMKNAVMSFLFAFFVPFSLGSWINKGKNKLIHRK